MTELTVVLFPELGIAGRSSLQAEENEFHCGHVGFGSLLTQPHGVSVWASILWAWGFWREKVKSYLPGDCSCSVSSFSESSLLLWHRESHRQYMSELGCMIHKKFITNAEIWNSYNYMTLNIILPLFLFFPTIESYTCLFLVCGPHRKTSGQDMAHGPHLTNHWPRILPLG